MGLGHPVCPALEWAVYMIFQWVMYQIEFNWNAGVSSRTLTAHCNALQESYVYVHTQRDQYTATQCVKFVRGGFTSSDSVLCCHVLQCVAVCCSVLQCVAVWCMYPFKRRGNSMSHVPHIQHTLQHTATHCNTLQHTATHCNTLSWPMASAMWLQHTATHCNTLQHVPHIQHIDESCPTNRYTTSRTHNKTQTYAAE